MFDILYKKETYKVTFNSLENAKIFARKAESEMETRFAGNFADPSWVCISDEYRIYYCENDFHKSGKFTFYKVMKA